MSTQNRIIVYAFRYALGRSTGSVDDVISTIKENVDNFKGWELKQIQEEILQYKELYGGIGDQPYEDMWLQFVGWLENKI